MRKFVLFTIASVLLLVEGLAWAQKPVNPRQPTPVISPGQTRQTVTPLVAFGGSVTPASVTFTSSNPDGSVTGSSTATVSFFTFLNPTHFTVYAKAASANFTGCNTPPAGSITAACSAPTGVTCAASAALTSTGNGTTVATGSGNQLPARFTVTYTFQDGWSYQVGTGCPLTVQYLYTEP
jgi:hypothetical protein